MAGRKYTVLLPVKGSRREMNTLPGVLRSIAALRPEPDQVLMAIDGDAPESLEKRLRGWLGRPCDFVRVRRDPAWRTQFTHVIYEMYRASRNDVVLRTDADNEIMPVVMGTLGRVGEEGVVAFTFLKEPMVPGLLGSYRHLVWRVRRRLARKPWPGIYWMWRPYYMDLVSEEAMMKVYSGEDLLLRDNTNASPSHDYVFIRTVGSRCYDDHTDDYPHTQFVNGMWAAIRRKGGPSSQGMGPYLRGLLFQAAKHAVLAHPWHAYGIAWALTHPSHPLVRKATGRDKIEWASVTSKDLRELRRWKGAEERREFLD